MSLNDLSNNSTAQWLALLRAPNYGNRKLLPFVEAASNINEFFTPKSFPVALPDKLIAYLQAPHWEAVENDLKWLEKPNNHFIHFKHPDYPTSLKEIPDPPLGLFVCGDPQLLKFPQIAIIGSRNASQNGHKLAYQFARDLASKGFCITSGLAIGIDGEAHKGALKAGGKTIAIAGTGLDRVYPARHFELAHQISKTGALVSEFFPTTPPRAGHFPRRNRIISGLSAGTLVVEAALKSGSLITARLAMEQSREVFAIPGSIHNPRVKGCHQLIRDGASLVETSQHIIDELKPLVTTLYHQPPSETSTDLNTETSNRSSIEHLDPDYQLLIEKMEHDPISVDKIIEKTGFTAADISSMLLILELDNHIEALDNGSYQRLSTD